MSNELRARFDFVSGTLSASLTSGATSMSSAGLANLGVIDSTNHAAITIENEIVWVTAHTAGATTATIARGKEGTSAAAHSSPAAWQHGPTAYDLNTAFPLWVAAWTPWTPTLTNLTLGSGAVTARYQRVGRLIHWRFKFVYGSGSAVGSDPRFSLPVAAHADYAAYQIPIGRGSLLDTGSANRPAEVFVISGSTAEVFYATTTTTTVTSTVPHTWGSTDVIAATGFYESAS